MTTNIGRILCLLLLATAVAATAALSFTSSYAQQSTTGDMAGMGHSTVPENVIDGRVHPERISDADAYRMFLLATIPKDNSQGELDRQIGMFYKMSLTAEQKSRVAEVLAEFATSINEATEDYNSMAENGQPDHAAYSTRERQAVAETEARIELILGQKKTEAFHGFIQAEKSKMRIAVE